MAHWIHSDVLARVRDLIANDIPAMESAIAAGIVFGEALQVASDGVKDNELVSSDIKATLRNLNRQILRQLAQERRMLGVQLDSLMIMARKPSDMAGLIVEDGVIVGVVGLEDLERELQEKGFEV